MSELYVHFAYPILILILALFFVYRLKITQAKNTGGVGLIYAGLILIFLASIMNLVEQHPNYPDWFLDGVYPLIVIADFAVIAAGLILLVIGIAIYFSYWGDKILEVESHIDKLKILETIQQECRLPYPVPELLDRALWNLLSSLDEKAGAAFLFNGAGKSFNLATAIGVTDDEKELLKDYQYGRNVVSESLDNAIPLITSDFRSFGGKAQLALNRFNSLLVMPLVSGKTRLGAVLFFSSRKNHYTEEFVTLVGPIIDWLSAKIEISQMTRTIKKGEVQSETSQLIVTDQLNKLRSLVTAAGEADSVRIFIGAAKNLADADESLLISPKDGQLIFHGGIEPKEEFTDNFRAALFNALAKGKPLVLNQEETGADGKSLIVRSSILYPVNSKGDALLLIKKGKPFKMSDTDIKMFDLAAALARIVLNSAKAKSAADCRRYGFETIAGVLNLKLTPQRVEQGLKSILNTINGVLSSGAIVLLFRRSESHFEIIQSNVDNDAVKNIIVAMGEGGVGKIAAVKYSDFESGAGNVDKYIEQYQEENRILLKRIINDRKGPVFQGDYPILINNRVDYVISIYDFEPYSSGDTEKHQLLSILTGLFNLRLELAAMNQNENNTPTVKSGKAPEVLIIAGQPVILDLMKSMCLSMDCRVKATARANEALSMFEANRPNIVIIDLAEPEHANGLNISDLAQRGISAWDIASRIKAISATTPIVGVAGWGSRSDDEKMKEAGFDFVLRKPFRLEQLHDIIFEQGKSDNLT